GARRRARHHRSPARRRWQMKSCQPSAVGSQLGLCLIASGVLVAIGAGPAMAGKPNLAEKPKLPPPATWKAPVPTTSVTPGGTRVAVLPEHELPIVHVMVTIAAGSGFDPPHRPGMAAAVATMLQDGGAGKRTAPEVADAFADLGVDVDEHVDQDDV